MKVVLSHRARSRLGQIHRYTAQCNPAAADRIVSRIRQVIELLADFLLLGRIWEDGQTRAILVSGLPYRVHYEIDESAAAVVILTIAHTSRRSPDL